MAEVVDKTSELSFKKVVKNNKVLSLNIFKEDSSVVDSDIVGSLIDLKDLTIENAASMAVDISVVVLKHEGFQYTVYYSTTINKVVPISNIITLRTPPVVLEPTEFRFMLRSAVLNDVARRKLTGIKTSFSENLAPLLFVKARDEELEKLRAAEVRGVLQATQGSVSGKEGDTVYSSLDEKAPPEMDEQLASLVPQGILEELSKAAKEFSEPSAEEALEEKKAESTLSISISSVLVPGISKPHRIRIGKIQGKKIKGVGKKRSIPKKRCHYQIIRRESIWALE